MFNVYFKDGHHKLKKFSVYTKKREKKNNLKMRKVKIKIKMKKKQKQTTEQKTKTKNHTQEKNQLLVTNEKKYEARKATRTRGMGRPILPMASAKPRLYDAHGHHIRFTSKSWDYSKVNNLFRATGRHSRQLHASHRIGRIVRPIITPR